jgi:hypothetical protein
MIGYSRHERDQKSAGKYHNDLKRRWIRETLNAPSIYQK